jgi:hypothetical protein
MGKFETSVYMTAIVAIIVCLVLFITMYDAKATGNSLKDEEAGAAFVTSVITREMFACSQDNKCKYFNETNEFIYGVAEISARIVTDARYLNRIIIESKKSPESQQSQ